MFTDKQKQSFNDAVMDASRNRRLEAAIKWIGENLTHEDILFFRDAPLEPMSINSPELGRP